MPTRGGQGDFGELHCGETVSASAGMHGVVGDRMARSWSDVNQGSRSGERNGVHGPKARRTGPEGDRASVVARKQGNACGAKGGRKVEYGSDSMLENTPPSVPIMGYTRRRPSHPIGVGHQAAGRPTLSAGSFARSWGSLPLASSANPSISTRAPTDWRAGCGKSASPVREGERFYPAPTSSASGCASTGITLRSAG